MNDSKIEKTLSIPQEHACFKDHFPEQPLVPGALLISWLVLSLQEDFSDLKSRHIKSVKFVSPVFPGDECRLIVDVNREKQRAKIALTRGETLLLKGNFQLEPLQG